MIRPRALSFRDKNLNLRVRVPYIGRGLNNVDGGIAARFQSVNTDGWSVTYASPPTFEPDTSPELFTVSRQGFDTSGSATTYSENLICTQRVRQAFPNQASLTADRVALSDYIYSTDTIAGVTNNSAEASPKPIANWAMYDRAVVGNTIPRQLLEVVAFHRNARSGEEVACVEWTITDGTNTVTVRTGTSVVSGHAGDANAVIVYRPDADVDVSTLADNVALTVNARVFPWIGSAASGSILNSADQSAAREFSPRTFWRHVSRATSPIYAYVATVAGGTPTTSTDPAVAKANPYGTIYAAMSALATATSSNAHGCIIRLMNGTQTLSGNASVGTYAPNGNLIIERDPDEPLSAVTLSLGSTSNHNMRTPFIHVRNLQLLRTGTFFISGYTSLVLENCVFDANSQNSSWIQGSLGRMIGVTLNNANLGSFAGAGANPCGIYRGVSSSTLGAMEGWLILGTTLTTTGGASLVQSAARSESGSIVAFSRFNSVNTTQGILQLGDISAVTGAAFCQNLVEYISATSQTSIRAAADSFQFDLTHIVLHNNTFAGFFTNGRANLFYEDGATPRVSKLQSLVGNIHVQLNTKGDIFVTSGTRVGNWAYLFGVGCRSEFSQFIDADNGGLGSAFAQAYPGLGASIGTSNSVRNNPLFTAYAGTDSGPTAGSGGGTYTLSVSSPCKGKVTTPVLKFDLAGNARSLTAATMGAYE